MHGQCKQLTVLEWHMYATKLAQMFTVTFSVFIALLNMGVKPKLLITNYLLYTSWIYMAAML